MTVTDQRSGRAYRRAKDELRARGDTQPCWRCGKVLFADAPAGHPRAFTLGHVTALEDGGELLNPANYAAECGPCNFGDGARRTNRKRRGEGSGVSYRNPAY